MRYFIFFFWIVSLCGCLQTRRQIRSEQESTEPRAAAPIEEHRDTHFDRTLDEIRNDFIRLESRIEELEVHTNQIEGRTQNHSQQIESLLGTHEQDQEGWQKLQKRIKELEQNQAEMQDSAQKLKSFVLEVNADQIFQQGVLAYQQQRYDAAIDFFKIYLKNSKNQENAEIVFYKAESYYFLKDYQKAIFEYSKFPEKFRSSKYFPIVLYHLGLSFEALDRKEDARSFYQELIQKYPKSSEASHARKKLKLKKSS